MKMKRRNVKIVIKQKKILKYGEKRHIETHIYKGKITIEQIRKGGE